MNDIGPVTRGNNVKCSGTLSMCNALYKNDLFLLLNWKVQ